MVKTRSHGVSEQRELLAEPLDGGFVEMCDFSIYQIVWRCADKKPVKNRQLRKQVDELRSRKYVEVVKVKAHSGIKGNERADTLAVDAARNDID